MSAHRWRVFGAVSLAAALGSVFALTSLAASSPGAPPPEVAAEGDAWPAHNFDL